MEAILRITEQRGQPPSWWDDQSREDQKWMLARLRNLDEDAARAASRNRGRR